jgi:hypothetical protein
MQLLIGTRKGNRQPAARRAQWPAQCLGAFDASALRFPAEIIFACCTACIRSRLSKPTLVKTPEHANAGFDAPLLPNYPGDGSTDAVCTTPPGHMAPHPQVPTASTSVPAAQFVLRKAEGTCNHRNPRDAASSAAPFMPDLIV